MLSPRLVALIGALLCGAVLFSSPAFADDDMQALVADLVQKELSSQGGLQASWSSGLRITSADKKIKLKMGGHMHLDHWWVDDSDVNAMGQNFEDGADVRRLWLYTAGLIHGNVEYRLMLDFFDPEDPIIQDAYIGLTNLDDCYGCLMPSIRVGRYKAPLGMEWLTGASFTTFMERSAATSAFVPGRKYGVMLHDRLFGDQFTWALGWFAADIDSTDEPWHEDGDLDFGDGHCFVGRVTYTPWFDCDCACRRLHLGLGIAHCDLGNDRERRINGQTGREIRFRARPFVWDAAPFFADTGAILADSYTIFNAELAFVYGPWSLQAEYFLADVKTAGNDPSFNGWYVQASYWLTGECRNYRKGNFGRVKPCCNFLDNDCCCWGAWELAVRYDYLDLQDENINGGEQSVFVFGVNWHLNPNTRIMFNYFYVDIDGGPLQGGNIANNVDFSGFGMRVQVDW